MWLKTLPIIGNLFNRTIDVIREVVPDKDLAVRLESEITKKLMDSDFNIMAKEIEAQATTLAAELTGSTLQRSWRPHLMYLMMFFLFWIVVVVPVASVFGIHIPVKSALSAVPQQMWTLLTVGIGGYTLVRGGEKMVKSWSNRKP